MDKPGDDQHLTDDSADPTEVDEDDAVADAEEEQDPKPKPSPTPRPRPRKESESESDEDSAEEPDSDSETEPDEGDTPDSEETATSPRSRGLAALTVVSLVLTGLLVIAGAALWYVQGTHDHEQRDKAITVAARESVLALLTLDPKNVDGSMDKVLDGATGNWRQEFAKQADQFTKVVQNGEVQANATITGSAIQSADDNRATVLVSANAVIRNSDSPDGYPGVYRVLMNLERQGDRWLIADLQFVA